ncbi:protein MpRLK-Pelle_L-LEC1 [Marchantia polymorpha subsp. ruderalis]|nr:hypothetical protein MARPO_0036s0120 [Marchantia polymorpha]BBM97845.1 hypothetical protein Mp_1g08790 [Marchantia polymorpha subsp. ruderalis]|eukprot:PTQ41146.1 hypothetical protein MARPO_0036s0120 [Marchantia polymorpha]
MICLGDASSQGGRLTLTPDSRQVDILTFRRARGMALYAEGLRMVDPGTRQSGSFTTSFTFRVTPVGTKFGNGGDGLAFVAIASRDWIGSPGAFLGVYNGSTDVGQQGPKTLAVEFDTFKNADYDDPNGNHVGVDLETVHSKVVANAYDVGVDFRDGQPTYAWIDYNGTTHDLDVRIANSSARPQEALLQFPLDVYDVFAETMWVGFSAANGWGVSLYTVKDWVFTSYGLPTGTLSAPPPRAPGPERHRDRPVDRGVRNLIDFLGLSIGIPCVLILSALALWSACKGRTAFRKRSAARFAAEQESVWEMGSLANTFSYKQLSAATNAFSEKSKLGQGGFGSVYRGVLAATGEAVAIKRVAENSKQGEREFMSEVSIITQIRHRNIVQLLGWCRNDGKFLLVYELMPNGSLDKALFEVRDGDEASPALSWAQRFKIVHGLAAALDYLHEGWIQQVIHRDVKSSNIMLDREFNAKLGDFGLARMVDHQKTAATTQVAGTYGYIAPEAPFQGKFTVKTDVYAFGAVALEIACGRRAFDNGLPVERMILLDYVWSSLSRGQLMSIVDRRLEGQFDESEITLVLLLGLICSHPDPSCRPSMRQVIQILSGDVPMVPVPASKPAPMYSSDLPQIHYQNLLKTTSFSSSSTSSDSSGSSRSSPKLPPAPSSTNSAPLLGL